MAGVPNPPKRVDLNEADYAKLREIYQTAYLNISAALQGASDFGRLNRANLLQQIQVIMAQYGTDVGAFIKTEVPEQYQIGAQQAIDGLNALGIKAEAITAFSTIDKEAIEAITKTTTTAIGAAMQGVTKNMTTLLSQAAKSNVQQRIIEGRITGEARQTIKQKIVSDFQSQGIGSLEDAGGKTWGLDTYADMVIRTNAAAARNQGIANAMLSNDQDLVEISDSGSDHPACEEWEGEVCSISGNSDDYPSLDDATAAGLFHPNCQHTYSPYTEDLSDQTIEYDNPENDDSGDDGDAG